jgi:hypothetical protein
MTTRGYRMRRALLLAGAYVVLFAASVAVIASVVGALGEQAVLPSAWAWGMLVSAPFLAGAVAVLIVWSLGHDLMTRGDIAAATTMVSVGGVSISLAASLVAAAIPRLSLLALGIGVAGLIASAAVVLPTLGVALLAARVERRVLSVPLDRYGEPATHARVDPL